MISIILYGRNDSYGYNLHKRAALSFNCMAELLADESDEIIFVDYNTPDDFPTFPEAIADTLTARARQKLRILRARPPVHERYRGKTRLQAIEPISRNIAVRRSNPANRWILSTNTDMIFVPRDGATSLSEMVRDLPSGFYHAPRLEIPETLWEGLDRKAPMIAIDTIKNWGRTLHLDEIVLGNETILYDGPGDFQLIERKDLFQYDGFDEEMILGWHVDSNIAKRMSLVYGQVGDLGSRVFGYHCDHTRQITPAHSHSRTQNDWLRFVDNVERPEVPRQAAVWGCAADEIEEIRLADDPMGRYVNALSQAVGAPLEKPPIVRYTPDSYGSVDYDPKHVLAFLLDIFVTANTSQTKVGWSGVRRETLEMFSQVWASLGFVHPILVDQCCFDVGEFDGVTNVLPVDRAELFERADAFVFDFGAPELGAQLSPKLKGVLTYCFLDAIGAERASMASGKAPRRVVSLNAIHTPYESLVAANVAAGLTPFATRMRHGFVLPDVAGPQDWTDLLRRTDAAVLDGKVIRVKPDATGMICFGPYRHLSAGCYRLVFEIAGIVPGVIPSHAPVGFIQLVGSEYNFGYAPIRFEDLVAGKVTIELEVDKMLLSQSASLLQTRVVCSRTVGLSISSLTCEKVDKLSPERRLSLQGGSDWLAAFRLGAAGRWQSDLSVAIAGGAKDLLPDAARFLVAAARAKSNKRDAAYAARNLLATAQTLMAGPRSLVGNGPQALLMAGRYELRILLETEAPDDQPCLFVGLHSKGRFRRADTISGGQARAGDIVREFEVHADESPDGEMPVDIFIHALGYRGRIKSFRIRRTGEVLDETPWVDQFAGDFNWLMGASTADVRLLNDAPLSRLLGRWTAKGELAVRAGERGQIAVCGRRVLTAGRYEASVQYKTTAADKPFLFVVVHSDGFVRGTSYVGGRGQETESRFHFEVHADEVPSGLPVEVSLRAVGGAPGTVRSVKVTRIGDATQVGSWVDFVDQHSSWLPLLASGPAAKWNGASVTAAGEGDNNVVHGPYLALPPGAYTAVFELATERGGKQVGSLDVVADGKVIGEMAIHASGSTETFSIPFDIADGMGKDIETRVWSKGAGDFRVLGVKVEKA
ncbi:hypothetical protein [Tardiphaga sp.]|uniref:hypothetical protein n=1 Tax=Tardiphaga sp. TaxID=1926292 RepID=UPI00352A2711